MELRAEVGADRRSAGPGEQQRGGQRGALTDDRDDRGRAGEALRAELLGFARSRLGAAVAPKEIEFSANLPRTRSGKIMRRLLKARELGLPEGDLSTLESDEK